MSQSLSKLYIHATFHIKYTSVPIRKEEYLAFLKEYGVEYNETYLFTD